MADYTPQLVKEHEVRNFFTPPLDYDDVDKAELLAKIQAVETFIKDVYFDGNMPTESTAKIPALLLVVSQIVQNPTLAKKYGAIVSEKLGDYSYKLATETGRTPYNAYKVYRDMAFAMLRAKCSTTWKVYKTNDGL